MVDGLAANSVTWGGLEMTLTVPESALATQTIAEPGTALFPEVTTPNASGASPTGI